MRTIHSHKGQAIVPEYVVMFILVVGGLVAMTTFVMRSLQARSRDATLYMLDVASQGCTQAGMGCTGAANFQNGAIQPVYEPYYGMVNSQVDRDLSESRGFDGPIFVKNVADETTVHSVSVQKPPENAN